MFYLSGNEIQNYHFSIALTSKVPVSTNKTGVSRVAEIYVLCYCLTGELPVSDNFSYSLTGALPVNV